MQLPNKKGLFAILFIVVITAIPFAISYYVSTPTYKERYKGWRKSYETQGLPKQSMVTPDQVLLIKDEKVVIDRTCLVFKGITDTKVNIDIYLLDLDPEVPYPLSFSKEKIRQGIWLGNIMYGLLSAKKNALSLKIQNAYQTR